MLSLSIVMLVWLVMLAETAAIRMSPIAAAKFSIICSKSSPTGNRI